MAAEVDPEPATPALPALVNRQAVGEALGCSERHVQRLVDRGDMPQPVRIGALVRWQKQTIADWIQAGCPKPNRQVRVPSWTGRSRGGSAR